MFVRHALALAGAGVAIGLAAAGVPDVDAVTDHPLDPMTYGGAILMIATALMLPAGATAASVDPQKLYGR
jgi:hypothetical protein